MQSADDWILSGFTGSFGDSLGLFMIMLHTNHSEEERDEEMMSMQALQDAFALFSLVAGRMRWLSRIGLPPCCRGGCDKHVKL